MRNTKEFGAILILAALFSSIPLESLAVEAPGVTTRPGSGLLETIKGIFGQAEQLTAEEAIKTAGEEESGSSARTWEETLGRVWQGTKDFFNDRTARELLLDTLKLFLRIVVNIFTIIANLLSRILSALSGNGAAS